MSNISKISNRVCRWYGKAVSGHFPHKVVLCYHNVRDPGKPQRGWLASSRSLDVGMFERQMQWLQEAGTVVGLDRLCSDSTPRDRCEFAITFDDGYYNNIETVVPLLRERELPMTWFVSTGFVDDPESLPWWDLIDLAIENADSMLDLGEAVPGGTAFASPAEQAQWMNGRLRNLLKSSTRERRDTVVETLRHVLAKKMELPGNAFSRPRELSAVARLEQIEIGGHTVTHPNVALCSEDELRSEILAGKQRLEELSGKPVRWFAYPFGGQGSYNAAAKKSLRDFGFEGAVTLQPGVVGKPDDRFEIPRVPISPGMSFEAFKSRVLGAPLYALLYRMRPGAPGYGY